MLDLYAGISPKGDLQLLKLLGSKLGRRSMLHVNSTRAGGGVAEILQRMMPILDDLGIPARWEVIEGDAKFFDVTKKIHNSLQGQPENISEEMWDYYFEVNRGNAGRLGPGADIVFIHDPQPAPLIQFKKGGRWIWRCHIDLSNPARETASHLRRYWEKFDAAVFSVAKFALTMSLDEFIIPPSIDPISDKNRELTAAEVDETLNKFRIPRDRPIILQVSRFDRFKDPVGVVKAYRMVKKYNDCILVLAGSPATDDPEGETVLNEVREFAGNDADIHLLLLPPFSDRDINALQRGATVILQKSLKEGFGLTVAEAMWKEKPVIGGAVGGIQLQIIHGITGFLGYTYEGAAFRIRQLLNNPEMAERMGKTAKEHVRNNFLITRQIRDYLAICYSLENRNRQLVELS
jgi:trehalose synthase